MREAIGGSVLIYIFAIFIVTMTMLIGFTLNYMAAYRANNYIISSLEQNEGIFKSSEIEQSVKKAFGYNLKTEGVTLCCVDITGSSQYFSGGVVIRNKTYISFQLPLFYSKFKIPVKGETKTIFDVDNNINANLIIECLFQKSEEYRHD